MHGEQTMSTLQLPIGLKAPVLSWNVGQHKHDKPRIVDLTSTWAVQQQRRQGCGLRVLWGKANFQEPQADDEGVMPASPSSVLYSVRSIDRLQGCQWIFPVDPNRNFQTPSNLLISKFYPGPHFGSLRFLSANHSIES